MLSIGSCDDLIQLGGFDLQNRAPPHEFDQIALCLALLWTDCLHVNVGGHFQTRMAQQFLYNLGILAVRV